MRDKTNNFSRSQRRFRALAERLAGICLPRIRSQAGVLAPSIAPATASGYLRAWANLIVREVATTNPLPGLDADHWEMLIGLAVEKVVETEFRSGNAGHRPAQREAA